METHQGARFDTKPPARRRRRTIPIIDAHFQWKYTLIITALGVGITAIMGGFLYRAHVDNTRLLDLAGNLDLQQQVMRGDQIFLLYIIALVLVVAVALAFWGLVVTHRISGPLYILTRYLDELAEGRYPDFRPLRRSDELREFFLTFEEAINAMKSRDAMALKLLDTALSQALAAKTENPAAGLNKAIEVLEEHRMLLRDSLGANAD